MAALYFTLLLVLATFVVLPTARASGVRQNMYQRNAGMDGVQPNATALFQASAHSPTHCGLQCTRLDGCRSYTYIADQPSSCLGYDVAMTPQTMTPAAGATTFEIVLADVDECTSSPCQNGGTCTDQLNGYLCQCAPGYTGLQCQTDTDNCASAPCQNNGTCTNQINGYLCQCALGYTDLQCQTGWLESPCSENVECPVAQAQCFKGKCICTPGYYYSTGSQTCLTDCPLADLGVDFIKYEASVLLGTASWYATGTSLSECRDQCIRRYYRVLIYREAAVHLSCDLRTSTALTSPSDYRPDSSAYDYYQRTCA